MKLPEKNEANLFEWILQQLVDGNIENLYQSLNNAPCSEHDRLWDDAKEYVFANIKPREINTIEDLAKLLNNNQYLNELKNNYDIDVEKICKERKWVILFPYSDDNIEIRGYVYDEMGSYEEENFKFVKSGEFYQNEEDEDEDIYRKAKTNMLIYSSEKEAHIFMKWEPEDHQEYIWYIDTDYTDVAYFNIIDEDCDDKIWARCCIIDCSKILD